MSLKPDPFQISHHDEDDHSFLNKFLLGQSKEITETKQIISQVAKTDVTVLLRGESGTGKELAAQAIYRCSPRRSKPFVKVLCAAIPEGLLESELFGFERGAFTGAHRKNPGKFEFSNHGTIFLDEIGDIPQSLQAKLLQVLQDGEFSRIGGKEIKVNVRVIAATNRPLEKGVAHGTFREDLFYRLNVVSIVMPPLRKRIDDIRILSEYFLDKYCKLYNKEFRKISETDMNKMMRYSWPGNVRELENFIKRTIVLESEKIDLPEEISKEKFQQPVHPPPPLDPPSPAHRKTSNLKDVAREASRKAEEGAIRQVLEETRWNRRKAAKILGISYKTLLQKLKMCKLDG